MIPIPRQISSSSSYMEFFSSSLLVVVFCAAGVAILPELSLSAPCTPHRFECGGFTTIIQPPFYTNKTSPDCRRGGHMIVCTDSGPLIQFDGGGSWWYDLIAIDFPTSSLVIELPALGTLFRNPGCSFLYSFLVPTSPINVTKYVGILITEQGFFNSCQTIQKRYDQEFLLQFKHDSPCTTYNFYYVGELPASAAFPPGCAAPSPPMTRWNLSFDGAGGGDIRISSAGFSRQLVLREECFNCTAIGHGCTVNGDPGTHPQCSAGMNKKKIIIISACAGGAAAISAILCLVFFLIYCKRRKRAAAPFAMKKLPSTAAADREIETSSVKFPELGSVHYQAPIFSYMELHDATDGFSESNVLGDGGYGAVYRGKLKDGRTVAVKRLYGSGYKWLERFMNEVVILSRVRHQNLVTLYGCTSRHSTELLLVYEFVPNGTLADNLHGPLHHRALFTWRRRVAVAVEVAGALAYLHAVEPPIIHRDVKSTNILLDGEFHVKVADFGLSRLYSRDATHVSTAPQGTPGYVDPEYHRSYQLTDKSDVYSFGVVLVELISSKPAVDVGRGYDEINLADMAVVKIQGGAVGELVDPELGFDGEARASIRMVAELAFRCLQPERDMRPSIKEVHAALRAIADGCGAFVDGDAGGGGGDIDAVPKVPGPPRSQEILLPS